MTASLKTPDDLLPGRGLDASPDEAPMTQTSTTQGDRPRSDASSRTPTSAAGTTTARGTQVGGSGSDPNSSTADNTGSSGDEDPDRALQGVTGSAYASATPHTDSVAAPPATTCSTGAVPCRGGGREPYQHRHTGDSSVGPAPSVRAAQRSLPSLSRDIMMDAQDGEESVSAVSIDAERGSDAAGGCGERDAPEAALSQHAQRRSSAAPRPVPAGARNVYVAALPLGFTDTELEKLLTPYGHVLSRRMFRDAKHATAIGRGYGFALFEQPEDAERAVAALNGTYVRDHKIQARLSRNGVDKKARRPPAVVPAHHPDRDAGSPRAASALPGRESPAHGREQTGDRPRRSTAKQPPTSETTSESRTTTATARSHQPLLAALSLRSAADGAKQSMVQPSAALPVGIMPASKSDDRGASTTASGDRRPSRGPQSAATVGSGPQLIFGADSHQAAGMWPHPAPYTTTMHSHAYPPPPVPHFHHHTAAPPPWALPTSASGVLGSYSHHHYHRHHAAAAGTGAWPPGAMVVASSPSPMPPGAVGSPPVAAYSILPWHAPSMYMPGPVFHHTTYVVHVTAPPGGGVPTSNTAAPS